MREGQSWGPACSISLRTKCETRRRMEGYDTNGQRTLPIQAERHMWYGYLFPLPAPDVGRVYSFPFCPFCGGEIREGLRTEILRAPDLTSTDEGDEC